MKKPLSILIFSLAFSLINIANAQTGFNNSSSASQSGFTGPVSSTTAQTIRKAKNSWDETYVVITGKIKSALGDEKYIFTDSTGEIVIDIDDDQWVGRSVNENTTIIIRGEVDKDWNRTIIDVDSFSIQ